MMERLADFPGLQTTPDYFERAYRTPEGAVARVRFAPQPVDPAIAPLLNAPAAPSVTMVFVSVSFVDYEGQVEKVGGDRLLVRDAEPHSWQSDAGAVFAPDAWLDEKAAAAIYRAKAWAASQLAAAGANLLPRVPLTPPVPAFLPLPIAPPDAEEPN